MNKNNVIVAIATAKAEAAIGIIRMSGEGSINIIDQIFRTKKGKKLSNFEERRITYGHIVDKEKTYDEVMALYMLPPNTYTCEETVEIYTHGNYLVMLNILNLLVSLGAKVAEAGEFTKRAFLNGRIDLTQAEAIMDIVSAKSKHGLDIAMNQLEGKFSKQIIDMTDKMTDLLAKIEVTIDYPDEDIEMIAVDEIRIEINNLISSMEKLMASYDTGRILTQSMKIAIIGRANVGKSSLLNAILKEDRAIVTHIAGTTRDTIEENASIRGIPVVLVDTAGLRDTEDYIEKLGIEKSIKTLESADLVILVIDAVETPEIGNVEELFAMSDKPKIICINKTDLQSQFDVDRIKTALKADDNVKVITMSVKENKGIEDLEEHIEEIVLKGDINLKESNIVTSARHYEAIYNSQSALKNAIISLDSQMPVDLIQVDLHEAYEHLGEIVGKSVQEDVISKIFEKFCLGK